MENNQSFLKWFGLVVLLVTSLISLVEIGYLIIHAIARHWVISAISNVADEKYQIDVSWIEFYGTYVVAFVIVVFKWLAAFMYIQQAKNWGFYLYVVVNLVTVLVTAIMMVIYEMVLGQVWLLFFGSIFFVGIYTFLFAKTSEVNKSANKNN